MINPIIDALLFTSAAYLMTHWIVPDPNGALAYLALYFAMLAYWRE